MTTKPVQHTPGPWHVGAMSGEVFAAPTHKRNPIPICAEPEDGSANWEADARLIAAAPELLEAAKAAKKYLEPDLVEPGRTVFWKLVAAISKAEGRQ